MDTAHQPTATAVRRENMPEPDPRCAVGVIGTTVRLILGLVLVGSVVFGQLATHLAPASWALGLVGFPALMLAWHWGRIRRSPAPFRDTSALSSILSVAVPLALYFTWWYAPAFSVTSDAALLFVGGSMMLAAFRADAGCELLALSNWLLRRNDQLACAVLTPLDLLERRLARR
jgi:hypothetical protein